MDGLKVEFGHDAFGRLEEIRPQPYTGIVMAYGYDGASRLLTVEQGDFEAEYQYETGSSRLEEVIFRHDATLAAKTQREFDTKGRLETIATRRESDGKIFSRHAYSYNELDQRTEAVLEDGAKWEYDYDMFGQVIEGGKRNAAGTPVPGRQFEYDFDSIGNRIDTTTNGRVAAYTANKLNQYTQRQVPGAVDVSGLADPGATVTVNSEPSARQLDYFHRAATVNNTASPVYAELKTEATKGGLTAEEIGFEYVPANPESFTYDADGNLLSDGRYNYEWDAENRLIALESVSAAPVLSRKKAEYAYDPQGRRVQRKVWEWSAVSNQYEMTENLRYLYHGWNLVAEINVGNDVVRTHVWGLDLSGSISRAGGVGGLLATTSLGTITETWFPAYDGNGNITRMINAEDVEEHAVFEYDPFGRQLRATGPALMHVPFRFSTKYWDFETGFSYYGFRYYAPDTGRWLSRDPIEEEGGVNLYAFCLNSPINAYDPLGEAANWHHMLPQEFATEFSRAGMNIHDAKFGWVLEADFHTGKAGLHPAWNNEWRSFFNQYRSQGRTPTAADIDRQLSKMKGQFASQLGSSHK